LSLMVAFTGRKEAIIGGDRRSIDFFGSCPDLEKELYSGEIKTEDDLKSRAIETCASIMVSDSRQKVWTRGEILVGEVTEKTPTSDNRRRIYLQPGAYIMADINNGDVKVIDTGRSTCVILGNVITRKLAGEIVSRAGSKVDEALFRTIFETVRQNTPSVSSEYIIFSSRAARHNPDASLLEALKEDCEKSGWRLCAQQ
jgi:hypothetical protein